MLNGGVGLPLTTCLILMGECFASPCARMPASARAHMRRRRAHTPEQCPSARACIRLRA